MPRWHIVCGQKRGSAQDLRFMGRMYPKAVRFLAAMAWASSSKSSSCCGAPGSDSHRSARAGVPSAAALTDFAVFSAPAALRFRGTGAL